MTKSADSTIYARWTGICCVIVVAGTISFSAPMITGKAISKTRSGEPVAVTNIYAARRLCMAQAKLYYEKDLLDIYVDDHSSRFDERTQLFQVYMYLTLGSYQKREHSAMYCYINISDYEVSMIKSLPAV